MVRLMFDRSHNLPNSNVAAPSSYSLHSAIGEPFILSPRQDIMHRAEQDFINRGCGDVENGTAPRVPIWG